MSLRHSASIRYLKGNDEHASSYEEMRKLLPENKVIVHTNTYLIKAFLEYSKLGLPDRGTDVCKVEIAMCVAVLIARDQDNGGLAKEVC